MKYTNCTTKKSGILNLNRRVLYSHFHFQIPDLLVVSLHKTKSNQIEDWKEFFNLI